MNKTVKYSMHFTVMAWTIKKQSGLSCNTGKSNQIPKYRVSFSSVLSYLIFNGNIWIIITHLINI